MRPIISRNPFTGQIIKQFDWANKQQIVDKMKTLKVGYEINSKRQLQHRTQIIAQIGRIISRRKSELSKLISFESGKVIRQAQHEVNLAIRVCDWNSRQKEGLVPQNIKTNAKKKTLIKYLPQGTVYCLLPSTFTFLLPFYKCIPQLLLGNGVLVRFSHDQAGIGGEVEKIVKRAGFQSGEFASIWNHRSETESIISNQQIVGVSFTGSTNSGRIISEIAGKHLKKYQVSGNFQSKMLIRDGDIKNTIEAILRGGFFDSGQGVAPKILIINSSVYQVFKEVLIERLKQLKWGNPSDRSTQVGPCRKLQLIQSGKVLIQNLPSSHKLIYSKSQMKAPFFPIVVLEAQSKVLPGMHESAVFQLFKAENDEHALSICNRINSSATYISCSKGWQGTQNLNGGTIYVNEMNYFDPSIPISLAGVGKQGGHQSIRNWANIRVSYLN